MKNLNKRIRIAAVAAAVAVAGAITVYAAYDSSKDPIVSLSYLTEVFRPAVVGDVKNQLSTEIDSAVADAKDAIITELADDINAARDEIKAELDAEYAATIDALQAQIDALSNVYEVVNLEKGKRITANAACEMVILSGSATVRSTSAESGIIDCTDGVILYDGQNAPVNHKLLVPDNGDGRGITCTGKAQVLIKGGYTVG